MKANGIGRTKAKAGDVVGGGVVATRHAKSRIALAGLWDVRAYDPIVIADPDKLLDVGRRVGLDLKWLNWLGWGANKLHAKAFRRLEELVWLIAPNRLAEVVALADGGLQQWHDRSWNRVVNVGLNDVLDKYFEGSTYSAAHYVGLTDGTPTDAAGDDIGAGLHAGWAEVAAYSESVRQTYDLSGDAVSSQSISNAANKATFSINATTTVGGAFLVTNNTKSGTSGILISVEEFTGGDKSLTNGDTLTVQITYTLADS